MEFSKLETTPPTTLTTSALSQLEESIISRSRTTFENINPSKSVTPTSLPSHNHHQTPLLLRILFLTLLTPFTLLLCYLLLSNLLDYFHKSSPQTSNQKSIIIVTLFVENDTTTSLPTSSKEKEEEDLLKLQYSFVYTFILDFLYSIFIFYIILLPLTIYAFPNLVRFILFPGISTDIALKLSRRSNGRKYFVGSQEFYLQFKSSLVGDKEVTIKLGVWHIPPQDKDSQTRRKNSEKSETGNPFGPDRRLVFLLAHGNAGDRSQSRPQMRLLAEKLGCHVVAFDYRGYADSTFVTPSADGLEEDLFAVYSWIVSACKVSSSRVVLWGHSLGGAIIVRMLAKLPKRKRITGCENEVYDGSPLAAILESTFSSLHDELAAFPLLSPLRWLPHFEVCIRSPITGNSSLNFDSVSALPRVHCPLLVLHAVDDNVIPFKLGVKLYESAKETQPPEVAKRTKLVDFPARLKCGHKGIGARAEMRRIISEFILKLC